MFELGQRKFLLLRPFSGLGRHVCAGLVRQGTLSAAPTAAARRVGFPASGQYGRFPAGNYLTPLYANQLDYNGGCMAIKQRFYIYKQCA